jgi:hypothetical protein
MTVSQYQSDSITTSLNHKLKSVRFAPIQPPFTTPLKKSGVFQVTTLFSVFFPLTVQVTY